MNETILYQDKLVEITDISITLKKYYFPSFKEKKIILSDIKNIEILTPTLTNGKWRIHGSGNLKTWFPYDIERPKRDKIFLISFKNKWIKNGFTVEDSSAVQKILAEKRIISVY